MIKYLALAAIFISSTAFADWDILDAGLGVFHSADKGLSETKMMTLGIQEDLWGPLKDRATVGGWLDDTGGGKSSSALASGQVGFEVVSTNGLVGSVFFGPAALSNTDVLLGGHFQFMDDLHLGIVDVHGYYIGIMYRHLSSAGLEFPNIGRDVIGAEIRF